MDEKTYRTKTGRILTDADIQALADEAERGYDIEHLLEKKKGVVILRVVVENPEGIHPDLVRDDIADALVAAGWGGIWINGFAINVAEEKP